MNIWPFRKKQREPIFVVVARVTLKGKADELCVLSTHNSRRDAEWEAGLRQEYQAGLYKDITVCLTFIYDSYTGPLTSLSQDQLKLRECN